MLLRIFHNYRTVVSTVMERPSQLRSLWITNSVLCRLITKDVFVVKVVCPWHPSRKHIVMFVHRLFINSLFSIVFECFSLKISPKKQRIWKKKGRKITIIVIKKPYDDAVLTPFSKSLSPQRKANILIDRCLRKRGDSDRRFATFYFSNFSFIYMISPYLSGRNNCW